MMNGYSVTEAASVLGVPTERVWELLARGVLAGAPEGETGMRVFLQPRQAPAPIAAPDEPEAVGSNGPDREMSPFRELLTEFRNLTERYGQALLALGESRGEVASLRSRVDLLEARIDLRLPMGAPAASPWPTQPLPVSEPTASGAPVEDAEETHRPRSRGRRRAVESFAEAMARTEDPSPADLPPSTSTGGGPAVAADDTDRSLPRDVLPAEPMLVADDDQPGPVPGALDEAPEPIADEAGPSVADLEPVVDSTLEEPAAADVEASDVWEVDVEPAADDVEEAAAESEPHAEADITDVSLELDAGHGVTEVVETEPVADGGAWTDAAPRDAPTESAADEEPTGATMAPAAEEPDETAAEREPVEFDAERYSTAIEEPDWFEAEADDDRETVAAPAAGGIEGPGGDEMEVAGGGHAAVARADDAGGEVLPGSRELDDALDAYGDFGRRATGSPEPEAEWPPTRAAEARTTPSTPTGFVPQPPRRPYGSVTSVGPANRAYRRLRRIFPT